MIEKLFFLGPIGSYTQLASEKFLSYINIKELISYHEEYFEKEVIEEVMEEFEFDKSRLEDKNLDKLSEEELFSTYADIVYFLVSGIGIDFETMYDVLYDCMRLSQEDVENLLDW